MRRNGWVWGEMILLRGVFLFLIVCVYIFKCNKTCKSPLCCYVTLRSPCWPVSRASMPGSIALSQAQLNSRTSGAAGTSCFPPSPRTSYHIALFLLLPETGASPCRQTAMSRPRQHSLVTLPSLLASLLPPGLCLACAFHLFFNNNS